MTRSSRRTTSTGIQIETPQIPANGVGQPQLARGIKEEQHALADDIMIDGLGRSNPLANGDRLTVADPPYALIHLVC